MTLASYFRTRYVIASALMILGASSAFGATPPVADRSGPSRQTREKMATFYAELSACLRSDKPMSACRELMIKNRKGMMGKDRCPMMGMGQETKDKAQPMSDQDHSAAPK